MTLLEWMADIQKATQDQPQDKIERLYEHGCQHEAQGWGLSDCLIAAAAMFNHDHYLASIYLYCVYLAIDSGSCTEEQVASHLEGRLRELRINI